MAFNFNWSPLIADSERVRQLLTSSLNKSPKPPIIVDDIVVTELNLGRTPPVLEILEVGDLAEDRFRGIFKMSYTGDAFLTLKTRVQANPLNTYLSTKPSFASPQPLAASSGLTIPLQITLSDIRLSGFVILVFSKQKGITLVFRNDPLESIKVSSTFDSIPFIRDYLQRIIESQLRVLFMEDLPVIIHRLSLRVFGPDCRMPEVDTRSEVVGAAQSTGNGARVETDGEEPFTLDGPTETYASFSQKNLLRLAALSESQRTLSLFTPSIRDTVYRAWATAMDRADSPHTSHHRPATLSRIHSALGSQSGWSSSAPSQTSDAPSYHSRPTLVSQASTATTYSLGTTGSRARSGKKRKHRVVNLRKDRNKDDASDAASLSSGYPESICKSPTGSAGPSLAGSQKAPSLGAIREGEISTPPRSPKKKVGFQPEPESASEKQTHIAPIEPVTQQRRPVTPRDQTMSLPTEDNDPTPRASMYLPDEKQKPVRQGLPRMQTLPVNLKRGSDLPRSASELSLQRLGTVSAEGNLSGGILEQAWLMKMATEIARKVAEEKGRQASSDGQADGEDAPPPAYVS